MTKLLALAILGAFTMVAGPTFAADAPAARPPSRRATPKPLKLSGAAKTSFVKKCMKDTTDAADKACMTQADEKKLAGAAKTSFVKKCVKDATAAPK
jgi:hypothetical protein